MIEDNKELSMENQNSNSIKSISNKFNKDDIFDSTNTPILKKQTSANTDSTKLKSVELNYTSEFKKLKDLNPDWSLSQIKEGEFNMESVSKFVLDTRTKSAVFSKIKKNNDNEKIQKIDFGKDSKISEKSYNEENDENEENNNFDADSVSKFVIDTKQKSAIFEKLKAAKVEDTNESKSTFENERFHKIVFEKDLNKSEKSIYDSDEENNNNNNNKNFENENKINKNSNLNSAKSANSSNSAKSESDGDEKNKNKLSINNNDNNNKSSSSEKILNKKNTHNIQTSLFNNVFLNKKNEEQNDYNNDNENNNIPAFLGLKRLRKKAEIVKEKERIKKMGQNFFEKEAELGSDNEDHDDNVKKIDSDDDEKENENNELDKDLEGLINDSDQENISEIEDLKEKYFEDMLQKDKEDIKKVIKGPEQRRKKFAKKEFYDNTDLPLSERMKKFKQENGEGDMEIYFSDLLFNSRNKQNKESIINGEMLENQDDELKQMIELHHNNQIKKFSDHSKMYQKVLLDRKKENEKILENVIDLNKSNTNNTNNKKDSNTNNNNNINNDKEKEKQNSFFIKGNFSLANDKEIKSTISEKNVKFGSIFNPKNSFLHAMKNDKYYIKSEFEDGNNLDDADIEKQKLKKEKLLSGFSSAIGNAGSYSGTSRNKNKNTNLSALFKNGNIYKSKPNTNEVKKFANDLITANTNEDMNLTKRLNN